MFDVGTSYRFILIEGTFEGWGESVFIDCVTAIDGPLLKLETGRIVNSHSSLFVSASPVSMVASVSGIPDGQPSGCVI